MNSSSDDPGKAAAPSKRMSDHIEELGRPLTYYPSLARFFGSINQAIFFCQLFYWRDKGHDENGWIYKGIEDWTEETGLSYNEQVGARKSLKSLGILEEKLCGIPAKLYYRINKARFDELWESNSNPISNEIKEKNAKRTENARLAKLEKTSFQSDRKLASSPTENQISVPQKTIIIDDNSESKAESIKEKRKEPAAPAGLFEDSSQKNPIRVPLPENFQISESMKAWGKVHTPGLDLDAELLAFCQYHRSKKSNYKDWTAAWRNWMVKAFERVREPDGLETAIAKGCVLNWHDLTSRDRSRITAAAEFLREKYPQVPEPTLIKSATGFCKWFTEVHWKGTIPRPEWIRRDWEKLLQARDQKN